MATGWGTKCNCLIKNVTKGETKGRRNRERGKKKNYSYYWYQGKGGSYDEMK